MSSEQTARYQHNIPYAIIGGYKGCSRSPGCLLDIRKVLKWEEAFGQIRKRQTELCCGACKVEAQRPGLDKHEKRKETGKMVQICEERDSRFCLIRFIAEV